MRDAHVGQFRIQLDEYCTPDIFGEIVEHYKTDRRQGKRSFLLAMRLENPKQLAQQYGKNAVYQLTEWMARVSDEQPTIDCSAFYPPDRVLCLLYPDFVELVPDVIESLQQLLDEYPAQIQLTKRYCWPFTQRSIEVLPYSEDEPLQTPALAAPLRATIQTVESVREESASDWIRRALLA